MALSAFQILLIVIAAAVLIGCLTWVIHLNLRARRLGLPSPPLLAYFRPPSSNPIYQAGGNRPPRQKSGGGGGLLGIFGKKKGSSRGEFGPLGDDSGAWDSRGYNPYHEEDAELGLRVDTSNDGRSGRGQGRQEYDPEDDSPPRGRSRSRSPRPGYDVRQQRGPNSGASKSNPFSDDNKVRRSTDTGRSSVFTEEAF